VFANAQLLNYWSVGGVGFHRFQSLNDQLTRGGPSALLPARSGGGVFFESDQRKLVSLNLETFYTSTPGGEWDWENALNLRFKPSSSLNVSLGPTLYLDRSAAQWVTSVEDPVAVDTFGGRYVFADLRQTQLAMTTRVNWTLSPRMSLQVYAQPLLAVGDYGRFKELARARTYDFHRYGVDLGTLARSDTGYVVDPDGGGPAGAIAFDDPDFNLKSLRVNAVFRWEWRLGSTLYVVWTQGRQETAGPARMVFGRDLADLFSTRPDDVLLVKVSYRFSR
jgi:hypothetical protein